MKTFSKLITLSAILLFVACSSSKQAPTSDADVVPPPPVDAGTDAVPQAAAEVPPPPSDATSQAQSTDPNAQVPSADQSQATASQEVPPPPPQGPQEASANTDSDTGSGTGSGVVNYTTKPGDTLMKIAFETYGDLYKWRDIYEANKNSIKSPNSIPAGTQLTMEAPGAPVTISRNGEEYRIRPGQTLGTISDDVYGTPKKWKRLWKNNRQLIKNPNKIFAGFSLYYIMTPEDQQLRDQLKGHRGLATATTPSVAPAAVAQAAGQPTAQAAPNPAPQALPALPPPPAASGK